METIFMTQEELEYLTNHNDEQLNENEVKPRILTREESAAEIKRGKGITLEEFSEMIGESIRRLIPNP